MLFLRSQHLSERVLSIAASTSLSRRHKKISERAEMAEKIILPPTLTMFLNTQYPLPVIQKLPIPPSSDIPPSPSPFPSAEPESLGKDQIETKKSFRKARADDTTEKKGKMEIERSDQNKKAGISPLQIFGKDVIKSKIEPERRALESQRPGARVEAPGRLRLSSRKMQRTFVDGFTHADGSLELKGTISLQAVTGMKLETIFTSHCLSRDCAFADGVATRGW